MGKNKAFLTVDGVPMIKRVYDVLRRLFPEIIIVANETDLFREFDAKVRPDLIPDRGVLGGLYTGLTYSSFAYAFCVACDMPFLNAEVIQYLIRKIDNFDVVVPKTQAGLEPLHAIYSKKCLTPIKEIIDDKRFKIIDLYPRVKVNIVDENELSGLDPGGKCFLNVNTPEELSLVQKSKAAGQTR